MGRDIATEVAGDGVATLALARPERRNALSIQLRDQIAAQLEQWAREPAVRAFPKPLLAAVNGPALAGRLGRRGVRASGDQVRRPAAVSRAFSQPSANPQ